MALLAQRNRSVRVAVAALCSAATAFALMGALNPVEAEQNRANTTHFPVFSSVPDFSPRPQAPLAQRWGVGAKDTAAVSVSPSDFAADPVTPAVPVPAINAENVKKHMQQLQSIADANGGDRSHGRPGLQKSTEYVKDLLDKAGYKTQLQAFTAKGATGWNLIADLPGGNPSQLVVAGAHLDAVPNVAGISDNGSGSATLLEVALEVIKSPTKPKRSVRFVWFGGEELIMVGSSFYVKNMSMQERSAIRAYLNYDMLGSPNGGYFIFDADNSDGVGNGPGPAGSDYIEKVYEAYYKSIGIPTRGWDFDGLMDYGPFKNAGIASGGIAAGASKRKTADEAKLWGGEANRAYDSCYHQKCDTITNINWDMQRINNQAAAYGVWVVSGFGAS